MATWGDIYFIRQGEDGPVKIGLSSNVKFRRLVLQPGNPVELRLIGVIPGKTTYDERRLHMRFASHWIRGEWFRPHPDILALAARWADAPAGPVSEDEAATPPPSKDEAA